MKLSVQRKDKIKQAIDSMAEEKFAEAMDDHIESFFVAMMKLQDEFIQDIYSNAPFGPPAELLQRRQTLIAKFQKIQTVKDYADGLKADAEAGKAVDLSLWPTV